MKKKLAISVIVLVWVACSSSRLYRPTEVNALKSGSTLPELQKGRKLYVEHCSNCHNLHRPSKLTPEKWTAQLDKMQPKAKISNQEKQLIYTYLISE